MPSQQFTLARKFQAASNGKIYIGQIDKDPTIPENQIQVYLENEDGSTIPVAQPLIINQAGFPVYNGQIAKYVTVEGHSMAVYDSYGAQQFYYPNVLKYNPDQFEVRFRSELKNGDGSLVGIGGGKTLKDKLIEIKTVTDYGVVGDGSDESVKMQLAIDSGIVRIPDNLSVSLSDVTIHKGTEFHFGINSALISTKKDAIKFERNKEVALSGSYLKNTTTVNSNIIINEQYEFAHIIRRFDSSDDWYIANAKNPDELGFQGLVLKVKSISGSSIELESPIPFDLPEGCTVNLYNQKDTHFFGGKIINADSGSTYLYNSNRCSDIYFHRTVFDFSGNGGCRHDVSANVHFNKVTLKNRKGNGSIFFGYGSDLSTVTDSIFLGGKGGDAQLIAFAGTRNVISQRNTFLTEIDSSASIGLYFGGKTVSCRSIDDKFTGGKYGFYSAYGAQGFEVIRPICSGQNLASVFCQDSQRFSILNATSNIKVARGNTVGCIVLRSCDEYTVSNDSRTLNADGGFIFSAYNSNAELDRPSKKVSISVMGFGDVNINTPLHGYKIKNCDVDGMLTTYYQNAFTYNGVVSGNEFTKSMTLHSFRFCDILDNAVNGNAGDYAVRFTGASIFCRARRNKLKNAKYAFSLPDSQQQYFSIALYQDNEIDASVQEFVNKKVTGGTKPVMGVISNADLPPKNFFLPVTNVWDTDLTTSVSGYRHTGKNTGTANDWIKVNISETA